jgi:methylamine---glutamate N-methyltransferase subunit A
VCGIIGLMVRTEELRRSLGELILPMFDCMAERGPDSAGLAVFAGATDPPMRRFSLFSQHGSYDWATLADLAQTEFSCGVRLVTRDNHAELVGPLEADRFRHWLKDQDGSLRILSVGRSIEVFKDVGRPDQVARRYRFVEAQGTHCIGHTRMATESQVSPAHAHPFTAGEDFCLVHNGSLSNPYSLRRLLEEEELEFETDNDSESACRFLQCRMEKHGETIEQALRSAFENVDGFYTFLIGTAREMILVRDPFACKPAVVAETNNYIAISSEFRSLAHLPGIAEANIFEPLPERIYMWQVEA